MKAILVRSLPPTDTRPRRLKASAEGVPSLIVSAHSDLSPQELAEQLCRRQGWPTDLVGGQLPNGDLVFCFDPHAEALRAGEALANCAFALQEKAGRRAVLEDNLKAARQRWDAIRPRAVAFPPEPGKEARP